MEFDTPKQEITKLRCSEKVLSVTRIGEVKFRGAKGRGAKSLGRPLRLLPKAHQGFFQG